MTVFGNNPGPYQTQGLLQSLDQMRQSAAKATIIARELGDGWIMGNCSRIEREVLELLREARRKEAR